MERLLLPLLVIAVIAVPKALPPPKDIGTGNQRVSVEIITKQPYDKRTPNMETEIKNYASKLGTLEGGVRAINYYGQLQYNFTLSNADCKKVVSWIADVSNSDPKTYLPGIVECRRKKTTPGKATDVKPKT